MVLSLLLGRTGECNLGYLALCQIVALIVLSQGVLHPLPPDPGPFDHLIHSIESSLPKAFSLPEDIRGFFKDGELELAGSARCTAYLSNATIASTGRQGAFVNSGELKPGRAK